MQKYTIGRVDPLEVNMKVRLSKDLKTKINNIVKKNKDLYDNESHFIRCAVMRFIIYLNEESKVFLQQKINSKDLKDLEAKFMASAMLLHDLNRGSTLRGAK